MDGRTGAVPWELDGMEMLLGDYGTAILEALDLQPMDVDAIHAISGVPRACIEGRLPFLLDLGLIEETGDAGCVQLTGAGRDLVAVTRAQPPADLLASH